MHFLCISMVQKRTVCIKAPLELLAETLILGGQKTLLFMKKRVL